MLWLSIVLLTSFRQQQFVNGWTYQTYSKNLPEGSACNTTTGTGICTRIEHCQAFLRREVQYANLKRCSFKGSIEITCCPISFDVRRDKDTVKPSRRPSNSLRPSISSRRFPQSGYTPNRQLGKACHLSSRTGTCTRISQCEALKRRAVAYSELTRCSFIGIEEVVCCPPTTPPFAHQRQAPKRQQIDISRQALRKRRPSEVACDTYKSEVSPRVMTYNILDGAMASPGEYPHVGAMLYATEKAGVKYEVRCGASLISARFALTAAHCVARNWPVLVRFGSIEWDPTVSAMFRFDAEVKEIIEHENYVYPLTYNDIALIGFTEDVSFHSLVYPACLPSTNEDLSPSLDLTVAGWGSTDGSVNGKSFSLMYTKQQTVNLANCNYTLAEIGFKRQFMRGLEDGQYCAADQSGMSNKDACFGDSGGPLMRDVDQKIWELVGLVSFGIGCGENLPSVYARVSYYLDWIESKVWPDQMSRDSDIRFV